MAQPLEIQFSWSEKKSGMTFPKKIGPNNFLVEHRKPWKRSFRDDDDVGDDDDDDDDGDDGDDEDDDDDGDVVNDDDNDDGNDDDDR